MGSALMASPPSDEPDSPTEGSSCLELSTGSALGAGAGVEADGGRGGEVEALGTAVDRDRDPGVGQRRQPGGETARLVAEHPGGRDGEVTGVGELVEVLLPRALGGEHPQTR